ncbi:hypothetical protein [Mameliella sp.]|uniref:hypothetical protein n=1 Tax=Mameliella sp. TaxID=1924940 RepID=UPI003B509838
MRFVFASVLTFLPAIAWADADKILSENCLALIAYKAAPSTFHSEARVAFDAFLEGSQLGRGGTDVVPAFTAICAANPQLNIRGAMRKAVAKRD